MRPLFITITAVIVCATASLASAAEVTRESYVAQLEPICKANTEANERILKSVRTEVKQGKLGLAGTRFVKAAKALKDTYAQLKAVPQPSADSATLARWLGYVKTEAALFETTGKALKSGDKLKAQKIVLQLSHNANLANNTVLSFDFRYCRFEPAKFT